MPAGIGQGQFSRSEADGVVTLSALLGGNAPGTTISQLILRVITGGLLVGDADVALADGFWVPNTPNRPLVIDFTTALAHTAVGLRAIGGQQCRFDVLAVYTA